MSPEDAQVEQHVVQRAQRQRIGHLTRAVLTMPAHMRRLNGHRVTAESPVEPAHSLLPACTFPGQGARRAGRQSSGMPAASAHRASDARTGAVTSPGPGMAA